MTTLLARRAVVMRIAGRLLALPVEHVIETMRPLPIELLDPMVPGEPAAPACVLGVARIRGELIRVIDAAQLLGRSSTATPERFVIVRVGDTRLALRVDVVLDIRDLGTGAPIDLAVPIAALGPVLRDARWIDEP